jgi:perosamine synthetase
MIPRKRLDVGFADVAYGLLACGGLAPKPARVDREGRPLLCDRADALVCLSVRSGLDLMLTEFAWPAGDEVLVSAITIPDIGRILREHGLRAVPVDLDLDTLEVNEEALAKAVTPRTRAVLVAHLFGGRLRLERLIAWAHQRGIRVWEDCAQSFAANAFHGHAGSDVCFFSFGTIKTATTFGGAVMLVRDAALREKLAVRHERWAVQKTTAYAKRLLKFGAFLPLQGRRAYGALFWFIDHLGRDPDVVIMGFGRGFAGGDFFQRIRQRPCDALRQMIARRLATYDPARLEQRANAATMLLSALRSVRPIGVGASHHTHWLFPLRVANAKPLIKRLRAAGFDATQGSSSLQALPEEAGIAAPNARAAMRDVLYVPIYAGMTNAEIVQLAALLNAHAQAPAS